MLKRNWNWRNYRLFCHIFVIGEISIGEGADPLSPSPWLRLCSKWGKQKRCSQIFCEVSGVFQRNFNCSKNSAVLEPRTGQFSRTWGFEAKAKAKDLTFEAKAKAKDFKMCPRGRPRGQGRPRGLHLWKLRSKNLWKLRTTIINRLIRLQLIICHKKELLSSLSFIKLVVKCNKCYQCKLVCTGTMNNWCTILTIKTLTEVNRT